MGGRTGGGDPFTVKLLRLRCQAFVMVALNLDF